MESPLVSVIMPAYKSNKEWLTESIDSVLNQSYKKLELIIICDEPTREIEELIQTYIRKDNRVRYIKNNKKFNIGKALNQGIFLSQGKYIARIDDDDIRDDNDKTKNQVEFLEKNNDYGLVGVNRVFIIDKKGNIQEDGKKRTSDDEIRNSILICNQFAHAGIMIRKECLWYSGIYDISCFLEDYDLWCRIGKYYKFCNIEGSIMYRVYKNSLSHQNIFNARIGSFKVLWRYGRYYPNFLKALILRLGEFFLPEKVKMYLLNGFKKLFNKTYGL